MKLEKRVFPNVDFQEALSGIPFHPAEWKGEKIPHLIFNYSCQKEIEVKNPFLENLKVQMEAAGYPVSDLGIWANLYENGSDHIAWHQDSMTKKKQTFILSIGSSRVILFRENHSPQEISAFILEHGDVLSYSEEENSTNFHCVPKMKDENEPRISIVFS